MRALLATILLASACSSIRTTELALPPPTGPHAVGTRLFDLTDAGRPDVFAGSRVPRRMLVQLFYPAASSGTCTLDAYMDAPTAEAAVQNGPLPAGFALRVKTNSCVDAPVAGDAGSLPVILFSHGLGASRFSYRTLCEELASRGYAVAAIQHTYGSTMTYFPDGTRAAWNEAAWESPDDLSRYLGEWVKDARFVVDRLALAPFPPQLDRGRLGYAGHSFGGSAAVLTAIRDPRVRAACNLDGRLFPPIPKPLRLDVPLLALLNESNTRRNDYGTGDDVFLARLRGTTHTTFSDTPWLDAAFHVPDELASKLSTPVRPGEAMRLTREAVVAFFDCTLRGNRSRCAALRDQLAPRDMP